MNRHPIVAEALALLACELPQADVLVSPTAVRDYLRLLLGDRPHEVFVCVFLDTQHRVIAVDELFRGMLSQTAVYPREVVLEALKHNAAALIVCHNHPSGCSEPSSADLQLTRALRQALALVDVRLLDHCVVTRHDVVSLAERGLI